MSILNLFPVKSRECLNHLGNVSLGQFGTGLLAWPLTSLPRFLSELHLKV